MHTTTDVGTGMALAHVDDGKVDDTGAVEGRFTFGQGTAKVMTSRLLQMYLEAGTTHTHATRRAVSLTLRTYDQHGTAPVPAPRW